ncbi:hypothetical protein BKK56_07145 [Rodentibacter genomosp. 2]|uniref:hypothetical protein n=1 Tax=Rodentibacter genomosp. 2 TaxID=1908266 RepID=UPI000987C606|nr:hypothetical protein BKK56_07145 [Rodentibacter genomosp. 2]
MKPDHYQTMKIEEMTRHSILPNYDFTKPVIQPEITIFVAPSGSKIIKDGIESTSMFGHVFIGVRGLNKKVVNLNLKVLDLAPVKTGEPLRIIYPLKIIYTMLKHRHYP